MIASLVIVGVFLFAVGFVVGMNCADRCQEKEIECLTDELQKASESLERAIKSNQPKDKT